MATDLNVGDSEIPILDVVPYDADTTVTLTLTGPTGAVTTVPVTAGAVSGDSRRWAGDTVTYTTAGRWALTWTVTGVGAGVEVHERYVVGIAAAEERPSWTPRGVEVGDHIPRLTVDQTTPGSATELGTFTSATLPTDVQAARHIDAAVDWAVAAVGAVPASLYPLARTVATLRAAASILRAYGRLADPNTLAHAETLDRRADADLARLRAAVADLDDGVADGAVVLLPSYAFPDPVAHGDDLL